GSSTSSPRARTTSSTRSSTSSGGSDVSGADSLLAPAAYSWWVPALGVLLLLAVGGWYAWVLLSTRHERAAEGPGMDAAARERYEHVVAETVERYEHDEIDLRGLHLELARTMR